MQGYIAAIGLALMLVVAGFSYTQGKAAGKTECIAERSIAADRVQTAIDLRDQSSATARVDMLDYLRVTVPPIEIRTHDTIERIRTVYENRVIPADCRVAIARPERVSEELSKARDAANARVSAMRRATPVASAPGAGMARDRPVGSNHDAALRDRSYPATGDERMPVQFAP